MNPSFTGMGSHLHNLHKSSYTASSTHFIFHYLLSFFRNTYFGYFINKRESHYFESFWSLSIFSVVFFPAHSECLHSSSVSVALNDGGELVLMWVFTVRLSPMQRDTGGPSSESRLYPVVYGDHPRLQAYQSGHVFFFIFYSFSNLDPLLWRTLVRFSGFSPGTVILLKLSMNMATEYSWGKKKCVTFLYFPQIREAYREIKTETRKIAGEKQSHDKE